MNVELGLAESNVSLEFADWLLKRGKGALAKGARDVIEQHKELILLDPHPFMRTIHHETIKEALSRIANPSAELLVIKPLPRTKLPEPGDKKLGIGFCG